MERAITDYHCDEEGDWVAELSCGHNQHVRHRPPFQLRPWVVEAEGRAARLGLPLECPLCDRAELPDEVRLVRSSPDWNEHTLPAGLRRSHRLAEGTWGLIVVHDGGLRFVMAGELPLDVKLGPDDTQAIPPGIKHEVRPLGSVRFSIDFLVVDRRGSQPVAPDIDATKHPSADEGGDPACWAGLLCPECGAVLDGGRHRPGCPGNLLRQQDESAGD